MPLTAPVTDMRILCMSCDRDPETEAKRLAWNITGPRILYRDVSLAWLECPACRAKWQCSTTKADLLAVLSRETLQTVSPSLSREEVVERLMRLYPQQESWIRREAAAEKEF